MTAAQTETFSWFRKWPALGSDAAFACLRRLLKDSGYTEEGICERANVKSMRGYSAPPKDGRNINDTLDALIALFFDCGFVEESKLTAVVPAEAVEALEGLGLLDRDPARAGSVFATAAILPAYGILTACDRGNAPDGSRCTLPSDVVYPAILDTTERFMTGLPSSPCDALLDLGTGTGIAALAGAPHSVHVWATDIAERAAHFAEFNRRLAGLENVTVVSGDLYSPVEGLTFDRIVTHPPYVPVKQAKYVFADAGEDGEQILRRVIQALPQYLRKGGRFYSLQVATDRVGEAFEQRVRKWLGPTEGEFDVVLGVHSLRTPLEFLANGEIRGEMSEEASRNWIELWKATNTAFMVYASLLIERHKEDGPAVTRRAQKGKGYSVRDLEWLLEWHQSACRPERVEKLLDERPIASPENELHIVSRIRDGGFRMEEYKLEIAGPFRTSLRCEEWLTRLLPECQGEKTWGELFEYAKSAGFLRPTVSNREFAEMMALLVSIGALKLPDWRAE